MKVYLARHGKTYFNKAHLVQGSVDSKLSEDGIAQANSLKDIINKLDIKYLYTGTLLRQIKTADIISEDLNLIFRKSIANFNEANFGSNEGNDIETIFKILNEKLKKNFIGFNDRDPMGICDAMKEVDISGKAESSKEIVDRFKEGLDIVYKEVDESKGNVLIISSGMAIGCAIEALCPEFKEYSVNNCSIHSLELINGKYIAESVFKGI